MCFDRLDAVLAGVIIVLASATAAAIWAWPLTRTSPRSFPVAGSERPVWLAGLLRVGGGVRGQRQRLAL